MKPRLLVLILWFIAPVLSAAPLQWYTLTDSKQEITPRPKSVNGLPVISAPRYTEIIEQVAREHTLDPLLLHAVIANESAYRHDVISKKGAVGLMQLMPKTAARYGNFNLSEPRDNIEAGALYLRDLLRRFNGQLDLALAGYNAGEGAVMRYGNNIPPYPETQRYVSHVISYYDKLKHESSPYKTELVMKTDLSVNKVGNLGQLWNLFTRG